MRSKLSNKLGAAFLLATIAGGCSQVLGLSDYEVDPAIGAGGTDASGGDGGGGGDGARNSGGGQSDAGETGVGGGKAGASSGGSGGALGGATGGGEAGASGGEAGASGGEGGNGGAPGSEVLGCDGTPFEADAGVLRSCILRAGCMNWSWGTSTISRCVTQNNQATYAGTQCTLDATSCSDILQCEGLAREDTDFCGTGTSALMGSYCDGDRAINCDGYPPYYLNCAKFGGTCSDQDGFVDCLLPDVTSCTATRPAYECGGPSSDYKFYCAGTNAYGTKCSNFAANCAEVSGEIGCWYPLNNCSAEGITCSNDRATWCDGTSKASYDCGAVGLSCDTTGDYTQDEEIQCFAPGCDRVDVATCQESCNGTELTVCYGGSPVTVDCTDYGFAACNEYAFQCSADQLIDDCLTLTDVIPLAICE